MKTDTELTLAEVQQAIRAYVAKNTRFLGSIGDVSFVTDDDGEVRGARIELVNQPALGDGPVEIVVGAGAEIGDQCQTAQLLANACGRPITFRFNDTPCIARPGGSAQEVYAAWGKARDRA